MENTSGCCILYAMTYLFQLTKTQSAVLLACFGYAEEAAVPAALCGYPVCALAPYAFSEMRSLSLLQEEFWDSSTVYVCSDEAAEPDTGISSLVPVTAIQENTFFSSGSVSVLPRLCGRALSAVSLPASVQKIDRYAFYGCEKLRRIQMYSTTSDLGTGLFMGCDAVSKIDMTVTEEGRSCLPEVLLTFRKPLELLYRIQKKTEPPHTEALCPVKYHLIFPEYFENADENTPARITTRDLHGSGLFYRNCFANTQFQITRYDSLFPHAVANEPEHVTTALAFFRLACPEGLEAAPRAGYRLYLSAHAEALAALLCARFQKGLLHVSDLEAAFSAPPLSAEDFFDRLLDETAHLKVPALSAILMELRHRRLSSARAQSEEKLLQASDKAARRTSARLEEPRSAAEKKQPRRRHFEL